MAKFTGVLLVSDMDGTLLGRDYTVSRENVQAISRFVEQGGTFTFATGRSLYSGGLYFDKVPVNAPAVLFNGALVYDRCTQSAVYASYLPETIHKLIADVGRRFPQVGVEVFTVYNTYLASYSDESRRHFELVHLPVKVRPVSEMEWPWVKVALTQKHDVLLEVTAHLKQKSAYEDLDMVLTEPYYLDVMHRGVNKALGVEKLLSVMPFDRKHVYTAGDGNNDIELLAFGAESFCPADAKDEVRRLATHVVSPCAQSAIACVIAYLDRKYA